MLWVRVALAVPSLLAAALLMIVGLFLRHVTLPAGAGSVPQTVDLGPAVAIVVVFLLAFTALIVWLAKFAGHAGHPARPRRHRRRLGARPHRQPISSDPIAYLVDLGWDLAFGALLLLSLVAPRPRPS